MLFTKTARKLWVQKLSLREKICGTNKNIQMKNDVASANARLARTLTVPRPLLCQPHPGFYQTADLTTKSKMKLLPLQNKIKYKG